MPYVASVFVDTGLRSLDRPFSYLLPQSPDDAVFIGHRVLVPFSGTKKVGIVTDITQHEEEPPALKRILRVLDPEPVLGKKEIELAGYMQKMYVASFFDCIKNLLPPGEKLKNEKQIVFNENVTDEMIQGIRSSVQADIVKLLQKSGGKMSARTISSELGCDISSAISALVKKNIISQFSKTSRRGGKKSERFVKKTDAVIDTEKCFCRAPMQKAVYENIPDEGISKSALLMITGATPQVISALINKGAVEEYEIDVRRDPTEHKCVEKTENKAPTAEQRAVLDSLFCEIEKNRFSEHLLHGVTGSGKTEVFLQLIENVIARGEGAIVLVPEISLTPQMTDRFLGRFGDTIAILHSALSQGERYDEWQRIKKGEARVVIGARSAIFAPIDKLGIIIVDESHESTYKSETAPYYNAIEIAKWRCETDNALLLLASATPGICAYHNAKEGRVGLHVMKNRYNSVALPDVSVVDMREELKSGNRNMISRELKYEIEKNLENREQSILFLNRRGFSTFVSCRDCGYVATCPSCSVSLTYHRYSETLNCHYCGYKIKNITECPNCHSHHVRYFGTGTQKLEDEIRKSFPSASCIRMDVDTTGTKNAHEKILETFKNENIDILLGTQMVSKGLDFPNISLVGVLSADMSLNLDDFRASERTFDLITQVCGRAGRGNSRGRAIIQTYSPDDETIKLARAQDYEAFYEREICYRQMFDYPPFLDIITVTFSSDDEKETEKACKLSQGIFEKEFENTKYKLYKSAQAPIYKVRDKYRWRYWIKAEADMIFREKLSTLYTAHKNKKVRMIIDINPNNMY